MVPDQCLACRAELLDISIEDEIGVWRERDGEVKGRCFVHLDAYHWVRRDSYLPQGSQGGFGVVVYVARG